MSGLEERERETLCARLGTVDDSLGFLLILISSVLLSFWAVLLQRKGLCLTLEGDLQGAAALPGVLPIQKKAGAMVVGSLGFFLSLALETWEQARETGGEAARRSAGVNLWASLFVLLAALLRFQELNRACREDGGTDTLPA